MDLTTLIRVLVSMFLVVQGTGLDKLGNFHDVKSVLIVVGGTLAITAASYPLSILADIPRHVMVLFRGRQYNIPKPVDQLIDPAIIARQNGFLALEEKAKEIKNPFFKQGILMIVDVNDLDKVCLILERELENIVIRHDVAVGLYEGASIYVPAFNMVSTLVELINMLKGLNLGGSGSTSSLGGDMLVASITTLYEGVLLNLVFHPIAKKLHVRQDEGEPHCSTIIEGATAIQLGRNPGYLREHPLASLKQSQRRKPLSKAIEDVPEGGEGS